MPPPPPDRPTLRGLDVDAHLRDPALKQRFVTPLFDIAAPRYDSFTRLFSFGMDGAWKRTLLEAVGDVAPPRAAVLDVACGTGDLAFGVAAMLVDARVTGIDPSERMIATAERRRDARAGVSFRVGDMMHLDVPDASVDVVTSGYGLRNVPDHRRALAELARVLRPGGRLVTLDFYRPVRPIWRRVLLGWLAATGSLVGWLWHREPVVYGYIARSIEEWLSVGGFSDALEEAGLEVETVRVYLRGSIAIHVARRRYG
jgi:demethylmenaquinone methyltransferase / 2-methoxy-6-polyprenyl-1,4-benzoquinol methylase